MSEKLYCGSVTEKNLQNNRGEQFTVMEVLVDLDKLGQAVRSGCNFKTRAGKNYIKLNIAKKQTVGQYGDTHSVIVDTWHRDNQRDQQQGGQQAPQQQGQQRQQPQQQANNGQYNQQQNNQQRQQYTPPAQPNDGYEDKIPF